MAAKNKGTNRTRRKSTRKTPTAKKTAQRGKPATPQFVCGSCGSHLIAPPGAPGKGAGPVKLRPFVAAADSTGGQFITILATPKNAFSWDVKLDGDQVGLTAGQPHTQLISSGGHTMTAELRGDPGATLKVTGTVTGKQVVECDCTILDNSKDAADPEDFTVA